MIIQLKTNGTAMLIKMLIKFYVQLTSHFGQELNVFNVQPTLTLLQINVINVQYKQFLIIAVINVNQYNH
jgi:hypothetical protein